MIDNIFHIYIYIFSDIGDNYLLDLPKSLSKLKKLKKL